MRTVCRLLAPLAVAFCLISTLPISGQTYTPKQIRIEGAGDADTAELLRIAALKPGTSLTKQEIEAALQRIGDTGMFTDLSYTVSSDALVFRLTASATSQSLPVRYANFVWWQPAELEQLVEARVPVFHGKLPFSGSLTDQVEAALTGLLREKGIDAKVTTMQSSTGSGSGVKGVALIITQPQIVVGDVHLQGVLPALAPKLETMQHKLSGDDLDLFETSKSIRDSVADIYQNAGYLDITTDPPVFTAPRKDMDRFVVDANAAVHEGDLYSVAQLDIQPAEPLSHADQEKAVEIKVGDPASPLAMRIGQGELTKAYVNRGYFQATAQVSTRKDSTAHTVAYAYTIAPGELFHLAGVNTSALTPDQQAAFSHESQLKIGMPAGREVPQEALRVLVSMHANKAIRSALQLDRAHHTATLVLTPIATKPQ